MYALLWLGVLVTLGIIIYKLYKISNSKELSASIIRDRMHVILLLLFISVLIWVIIFLYYKQNLNASIDQYPKIVVYDNAEEYQNRLGTEILVECDNYKLTHVKRTEVDRPNSDEIMIVITLGFEEEK